MYGSTGAGTRGPESGDSGTCPLSVPLIDTER